MAGVYVKVRTGHMGETSRKNNSDATKSGTGHTLIFCFRGHGRRGGHGGPPQGGSCTQPRALRGPKGEGEAPSPLGIKR